jgi:dienelactone hydrolase
MPWSFPKRIMFIVLVGFAIGQPVLAGESAYKPTAGSHEVVVQSLYLPFPALDKDLPLRVAFPAEPGAYPVIIFSHGNGSSKDLYSAYTDHWVSHGYVVIQPTHMDSKSLGGSMRNMNYAKMAAISDSRRRDIRYVVDSLERLDQQVAGLPGKMDLHRLVVAGHSMGGATAMRLAGLLLVDPPNETAIDYRDDRFGALLLVSDPGNNRLIPEAPWRGVPVPTFIATGSNDFGGMPGRSRQSFAAAARFPDDAVLPDTPNHYLFVDGMDHYLGGLICKNDVPGPRDHDALRIVSGVSTAFLDAYMKADDSALRFLQSGELPELSNGRASLDLR